MKVTIYIYILALLLAAESSSAQQLRFDRFDLSNGLSQNNINCMEFDVLGNVWLGTLDGINRYNGDQFSIFKPDRFNSTNLVGNHVVSMGQGLNGDMWMVTRGGGLNHFDANHQRFELIHAEVFGQFNVEQATGIVQTNDTLLWINTSNVIGVWEINLDKFTAYQAPNAIRGVLKQSANSVLIFGEFGIQEIRFEQQKSAYSAHSISINSCYGIVRTDNQLVGLFNDGIYKFDAISSNWRRVLDFRETAFSGFNKLLIRDFAVSDDTYWIGGVGFFVRFYWSNDVLIFQQFKNDPLNDYSFKGHSVNRIMVDKPGNLWIGTAKNGLLHLNHQKNQFQHYTWKIESTTDPESNPVRALCKTRTNDLWMGFDQEGIALFKANTELKYYRYYYTKTNSQRSIENARVIFEDSRGNVWLGVNDNLCIYNPALDRFESVDCQFTWSWQYRSYAIKEFDLGTVVLTSSNNIGLVNLNDRSLTTIPIKVKGNTGFQSVRDIVQDKYRNWWLALDNQGLLKISYPGLDYEFIQSNPQGLSDDKVYCLLASGDSLWVGTNSGLNLLDLKTSRVIRSYFEEDGLSNNIVYSILPDQSGRLWMSTNRGLTLLNPKTFVFSTFLPGDFFMDDAHFVDANGVIYYGGYTGVVSFLPEKISTNPMVVHPVIESFTLFNQPVYPGDSIDGKVLLVNKLNVTRQLELNYRQNTIGFGYNAYPFDYPNLQHFRYRLKNYQNEWINDNGSRSANFTKLPPGNYVFQLEVSPFYNHVENMIEMNVKIIPPFWMRTWFRMGFVIFVIASIVSLFRFRIKQIQQRNQWLQKKVAEQTMELREQNSKILEISAKLHEADESKLRFFTNISHEFRTPLTLILGHLENISSDSKQAVKSIRKNALRLLTLINQLIDLRKMDQDQLKLVVDQFELISLVKEVIDSFAPLADQKNMELFFASDIEEMWVWLDKDKTEKILYNLISNAIKYSTEGKRIVLCVAEKDRCFQIQVKDQGIGIPEEELDAVFDRFYRSNTSHDLAGGHGIGLSMVKGLTTIQHGEIQLTSQPGIGSCFTLSFLMGKDHFKAIDFGESMAKMVPVESDHLDSIQAFGKLGSKNILVVEDHQDLALFLENMLTPQFNVRKADNGKMALELLQTFVPDLIISDVMMPLMDGLQFCRIVKTSIETSHIPLILLSAKTDVDTQVAGFETGADDYIEKPFLPQLLLAKIQSLLLNREKLKVQFRKMPQPGELKNQLSSRDKEFLQKVNQLIEIHIGDSLFSIELLSEKLNMSRATFYRKFSDLTGVKPADYIRRYRLKTAYDLFLSTAKTTQEVCEMVGFQSVSHFRKNFKDEFGESPSSVQKG
ncbi:MAG: response regulator [Prolixibacteraceae bacterium]